jgi:hypothetical protein
MNPQRDDPPSLRAEAAGLFLPRPCRRFTFFGKFTLSALPSSVYLPYPIMRFFETLGIAN